MRAIQRREMAGKIEDGFAMGYYHLRLQPRYRGLVSIIMPTGGNVPPISKCLTGPFERTTYQNFELIALYNAGTKPEVFPYLKTFEADPRVRIIDIAYFRTSP